MKIFITGLGKSGTTALHYRIKNSFDNISELFEPNNKSIIENAKEKHNDIVVKNLLIKSLDFSIEEVFNNFDKKIYLVRDPRDNLISRLLYAAATRTLINEPKEVINDFILLLKRKETLSSSVSVIELYKAAKIDLNDILNRFDYVMDFYLKNKDYYLLKYEDMIINEVNELNKYLGFELSSNDKINEKFSRVIRTKSSESWRTWFTHKDVDELKSSLSNFMEVFNYDINDWDLISNIKIEPKHCSEYFKKVINEEREKRKLEVIS